MARPQLTFTTKETSTHYDSIMLEKMAILGMLPV